MAYRIVLLAALMSVLFGGVAGATGTFTEPSSDPFVLPVDDEGMPVPIPITVAGFTPNTQVYVEQCDGTPPNAPEWKPVLNCDLGSSPAPAIVAGDGTATFPPDDPNFAFTPFRGVSPQQLFNCLGAEDPSPENGLQDSRSCSIRVSSSNNIATADQVFIAIEFPAGGQTATSNETSRDEDGSDDDQSAMLIAGAIVLAIAFGVGLYVVAARARPDATR